MNYNDIKAEALHAFAEEVKDINNVLYFDLDKGKCIRVRDLAREAAVRYELLYLSEQEQDLTDSSE